LKRALSRSGSTFRVVSCAVSHSEVIRSMNSRPADIVLMGESLQDGSFTGFGVLSELRNCFPRTRVIVLLKSNREDLIVDAFRSGARGVFCRQEPLHALCKCIHAVHQGQIWANSSQLRSALDAFASTAPFNLVNSRGRVSLTKREIDVVKLVVDGHTNREIAYKLELSEHTVRNYLARIYEKLGISSRLELRLSSIVTGRSDPAANRKLIVADSGVRASSLRATGS
jgi:DNA-binding NarL/FixJ family response regulator